MWLLPLFSPLARIALRAFYRFDAAGATIAPDGPVLLVANHPNSLLDPAAVAAVSGRPVRFLAKAPLFSDPQVGWLIRGAGAIPVYRRSDDPTQMERNDETFRAAYEALWSGAAIGIFPEGLSHNEPALAPLKTGAARIALGAALRTRQPFPIIPIGLSLREKARFRSDALAVVGDPIPWGDLAGVSPDDAEAVRELTARIDEGLRAVTVNLQRWEDAPLVEYGAEIFLEDQRIQPDPQLRLRALREAAEALRAVRERDVEEWRVLARDLQRHVRTLRALGLRPHELAQPELSEAGPWMARNALLLVATAPIAMLGAAIFAVPYLVTDGLSRRGRAEPDVQATYKLLAGAAVYSAWSAVLIVGAALAWGWTGALATLVAIPVLGLASLALTDRRRSAGAAVRRYLVRTRRAERLAALRDAQRDLANRVASLRSDLQP